MIASTSPSPPTGCSVIRTVCVRVRESLIPAPSARNHALTPPRASRSVSGSSGWPAGAERRRRIAHVHSS